MGAVHDAKARRAAMAKPPWGRLLIGVFFGYIVATLVTAAFTGLLPISRGEETILGLILVGLFYTGIFIYVFAVPTWKRALRDTVLLGLISGGILAVLRFVVGGT